MRVLIIIFVLLLSGIIHAQYSYTPGCMQAHADISALKFDEAARVLERERVKDSGNLVPDMLQSYMDFITLMVGEDEADYERLTEVRGEVLDRLGSGDESSPWYRYSIARANLQWAFARVKFDSYFNAALDVRRAYNLLLENQELFPDFLPDKLGLGVLHALIGGIPDNYQWIAGIFSMKGSVEQGRSELLEVLEKAETEDYPFLKAEALFFISFLDLNLKAEPWQASLLLAYYKDIPGDNLLLVFPRVRILMQTGRNEEAIRLLASRPGGKEYYPFYYLDYLEGQCHLNRLDSFADNYFIRFTTNFKGKNYIKSAYQRTAWCALLRGDTSRYRSEMRKVVSYGTDMVDGDQLALQDALSGDIPDICLLKARLLYDGGYYSFADSLLQNIKCPLHTEKDSIEYPYRRGRIYHALDRHEEALEWYARAIERGREKPYYFAANAALQMGFIYEAGGDAEKAAEMYRQCIRMPKEEYKTSLNQKARAGLNRIRDKED